ncbi:Inner membrane protein YhaI [Commensalibacter sp. Nvir]|uniref:DUF805 domain-containing protein n=1 Tax=Commensalibacter sp. Nvir TaxID=3069817 RepID=UPI002D62F1BB|nr:Inner membrane protein YhaI [Commensalibacter sp. Nvir]
MGINLDQCIFFIKRFFKGWLDSYIHYSYYKGRSNRIAFWSFAIFNAILLSIFHSIDEYFSLVYRFYIKQYYIDFHLLFFIYLLISFFPSICLCIRRLHDLNLSGRWLFLVFIPMPFLYLSFFFRLIFLIAASYPSDETNRFGPKPVDCFTT